MSTIITQGLRSKFLVTQGYQFTAEAAWAPYTLAAHSARDAVSVVQADGVVRAVSAAGGVSVVNASEVL